MKKEIDHDIETFENIERECRWYTHEERDWLLDIFWTSGLIILIGCLSLGLFGVSCLTLASCCFLQKRQLKTVSNAFIVAALLNIAPLVVFFKSDVCQDGGICDEDILFCVSQCRLGMSSYEIAASCFMWTGSAVSTWMVANPRQKRRNGEKNLKKQASDLSLKPCATDDTAESSLSNVQHDAENPYMNNQRSSPPKSMPSAYSNTLTPKHQAFKERIYSPRYRGYQDLSPLPVPDESQNSQD